MSDLISETVRDIASTRLGVRLSESLDETIINKDKHIFDQILEDIELEMNIFISEDDAEDIETVNDLIEVCERIQDEKREQKRKNG